MNECVVYSAQCVVPAGKSPDWQPEFAARTSLALCWLV